MAPAHKPQPVYRAHHPLPFSDADPLAAALQPPPNETPEQREQRLKAEEDARKRSENIDRMLRHDDKRNRRRKQVKVLLLGQSESGKSTTLKQFQLLHTPAAFHKERIAWRFVIYLNLVRSIRRILEAIAPEDTLPEEEEVVDSEPASIIISGGDRPSSSLAGSQPNYESYRRRLAPLMDLEQRLIAVLSDPEEEGEKEATHLPDGFGSYSSGSSLASPSTSTATSSTPGRPPPITIPSSSAPGASSSSSSSSHPWAHGTGPTSPRSPTSPAVSIVSSTTHELAIRTGSDWKKHFALGKIRSPKSAHSGELEGWWEDPNDPVHTLNRCAPVMTELWRDPKVHQRLAERRIRLEESSGFYLDEIDRITAKMYFPTDDDVLKARLKTTGVVEHKFTLSKNSEFRGVEWVIYDVGGARNQRQAWAPYFDDVNAIIFLAPISAFDQQLAEDPRVNRLEDSFQLWKSVIESRLLAHVNIVLFLNKCDLLKKKLESGVRLRHYMPSYNRPNDYETVSQYFRNRFGAMHQSVTPNKTRELFIHLTSVTDTRKTHMIITNVRDIILTANLKSSSLM
ncbi:G-alpha-domain-containing protein [Lentinus tigrinus ALCF2SS1-7]|uniref:G-alpha-domain-containing protein n=1 Tax=Lentinus tigrinus ALCF2SS1-6 TaxID=1328759 RepID=A0A5C2RT54_9APHY|nr:G-alpha-domain-containing protein [Lentinus tigrinus ALCF2SS1-6]RPD69391.1 G-alpha-domain-containing protein [Lentinus tigrinus ALCF2SS1-7]